MYTRKEIWLFTASYGMLHNLLYFPQNAHNFAILSFSHIEGEIKAESV
jgi:hypothetical protein